MTGCIVRFSHKSSGHIAGHFANVIVSIVGCMDPIHLKHFGKKEILKKIDLMEPEFDQPTTFNESRVPDQPAAAGAEIGSLGLWSAGVSGSQRAQEKEGNFILVHQHVWILLHGGDAGCKAVSADTLQLPD